MALPVEEEKVFNHFSKFPPEIRDAIWKDALPFHDEARLDPFSFVLTCRAVVADPEFGLYFEFSHVETSGRDKESSYIEDLENAVSKACKESRAVFLKEFPHTLPVEGRKGVIRIGPNSRILFTNLDDAFQHDLEVAKCMAQNCPIQSQFANICHLVLPYIEFPTGRPYNIVIDNWRGDELIRMLIFAFKNLKTLTLAVHWNLPNQKVKKNRLYPKNKLRAMSRHTRDIVKRLQVMGESVEGYTVPIVDFLIFFPSGATTEEYANLVAAI